MKYLVLMMFLISCASTEKKSVESAGPQSNLKNSDFKKQKAITFAPSQDFYPTAPNGKNILLSETADKANSGELKSIGTENDQLAAMMALCYKKDFEAAFSISDKLFQSHLNVPTYWNQVATCHLLKGNERKALLFYNKALEAKANYVPALNNIAVIYNKNGQDQKAQVALQRALSKGAFAKTPRYNLAFLMLEYGLANKALPLFKTLSEDTPGDIELRVGLANSFALLERWSEAWDQFSVIPDARRKVSDVGLNMALTAHKLGKKDLAKNILSATDVNSSTRKYAESISEIIGE